MGGGRGDRAEVAARRRGGRTAGACTDGEGYGAVMGARNPGLENRATTEGAGQGRGVGGANRAPSGAQGCWWVFPGAEAPGYRTWPRWGREAGGACSADANVRTDGSQRKQACPARRPKQPRNASCSIIDRYPDTEWESAASGMPKLHSGRQVQGYSFSLLRMRRVARTVPGRGEMRSGTSRTTSRKGGVTGRTEQPCGRRVAPCRGRARGLCCRACVTYGVCVPRRSEEFPCTTRWSVCLPP